MNDKDIQKKKALTIADCGLAKNSSNGEIYEASAADYNRNQEYIVLVKGYYETVSWAWVPVDMLSMPTEKELLFHTLK